MDIQHLMRQARKIEKAMEDARASLDQITVEAESGDGLVKVKMDGHCAVQKLDIDVKIVDPADKAMLEDLVAAAINAAASKARVAADEHVRKATGGIKVPGIPF
ncbi:MAG TPA: YbaB/EbfC family nucleoid-associated protein [Anaeromyxobacteraceae bacterium]|nr:YbaB/EbfC family nucleoid-associated protein [Anaeromyxobacteraceae bacterium]